MLHKVGESKCKAVASIVHQGCRLFTHALLTWGSTELQLTNYQSKKLVRV